MKKVISNWMIDISKYLITGVVITSLLRDFEDVNWWVIPSAGMISSLVLFVIGLYILKERR